jgi:MFS family permease
MKDIATRNMRIHGLINLISGIVFLIPIITLFYKYTGLNLAQIILISNITTFSMFLFELPTSVRADTAGRKKSMFISVVCNVISAVMILLFPSLRGFAIAAFFAALYGSFRSGTGQAFLEENLRILWREKEFGKHIGRFMFYGELVALITPLIASGILKLFGDAGYTMLAGLDVISALILVSLVIKLKEPYPIHKKMMTIKEAIQKNRETAKTAIANVFKNKKMRLLVIYRSLSHHVAFFWIIFLPMLSNNGMPDRYGWFVATIISIGGIFALKYAYKIGEKYSYNFARILWTSVQWLLVIIAGLLTGSRIRLIIICFVFEIFDGLRQPSRNHVLVQLTKGKAIATTRSIIFAIFALYMTGGKQLLSLFEPKYALIGLGVFIIIVNIVLWRKILKLK